MEVADRLNASVPLFVAKEIQVRTTARIKELDK